MAGEFENEQEEKLLKMGEGGTKVLVTGGAGYLGSVLCEMLLGYGFEVTVVDNLSYGQNTLFHLFHYGRFKFIFGDVTNSKMMEDLLAKGKFDFVFPLAAVVGFPVSEQKPEYTRLVNLTAIENILKHRNGAKIIFPTTNSGYGTTSGRLECDEETPLNPISTYGRTKVEAEKAVLGAGGSVAFRFATLMGFSPRMRTDLLVNDFVLKAVREKSIVLFEREFKRNYLHVRDGARAFLFAMANWEKMKGRVYNVGHPEYNLSKEELCLLIKKHVSGLNILNAEFANDPDKRNYIVSNKRIMECGFDFCYGIDEGIAELVRGYEAFRDFRFKNY